MAVGVTFYGFNCSAIRIIFLLFEHTEPVSRIVWDFRSHNMSASYAETYLLILKLIFSPL